LFAALETFLLLTLFRWVLFSVADESLFKVRVLVLGKGHRAEKIAGRMRRRYDQRAFRLVGFLAPSQSGEMDQVSKHGAKVIRSDLNLVELCKEYQVDEIVVAMDERRRNADASGGIPLEELLECRMQGVKVCDVQQFIEREACKVDIDLLRTSWMVFSDGFVMTPVRAATKRIFDVLASASLLLLSWPFMLLIALLVKYDAPKQPVLFRQLRVGLNGELFDVVKFRSMQITDDPIPAWTQIDDPRITKIGRLIRKTRMDELPQLFTVLRGKMSFVGPRPERPMLVEDLKDKIPFYDQRHRVKPGITGWAQLCYPYGASVDDAKHKLQYDLYYLKNHSLLLDLIIILQTVEVVLVGEGAR
jgi:sugar transferase (PEP-CTERM system associated)